MRCNKSRSIAQLPLVGRIVLVASYLASKIASNSRVREANQLRDVSNADHQMSGMDGDEMETMGLPAQPSKRAKRTKAGGDEFRKRRKGRNAQASNFNEEDVGGTRGGAVVEKASLTFAIDRVLEISSLLEIQVLNTEEKNPFDPEVPVLAPRMSLSRASMLQQVVNLELHATAHSLGEDHSSARAVFVIVAAAVFLLFFDTCRYRRSYPCVSWRRQIHYSYGITRPQGPLRAFQVFPPS